MINRFQSLAFPSLLIIAGWMLNPTPAHAELEACGGIFLSGDANCEYRPTEECMTECMTVAVEGSCVATIFNECETMCTATASVECESGCTETCTDNCTTTTTTEEPVDCMGLCVADCDESCGGGSCDKYQHKGACGRCCSHNCQRRCEEKCENVPPPVSMTVTECMPSCTTACSASCAAKANTECQVTCQEGKYVMCETQMVETCETKCKDKGGAIFCDGQFINADDSQTCADELEAEIKIEIDIDAAIDTVEDTAEDVGDATEDTANCVDEEVCSVSNVGAGQGSGVLLALAPLGFLLLRRLRRRNGA